MRSNAVNVEGFFDDADGGLVAVGVGADVAGGFFGDVGAGLAEFDALLDARYGFGEFGGFSFGHADEVVGETLCGFGSDAGESAEGFDDACDGCGDAARCGGWR